MNNSMVAHLWANEKKESARGSNLFFEGRSIYSYGYHFEVGRIVRNKCGEKAYLLNDKYYSSSTCKHQRCVRSAIPTGSKVFSVGYNMSDDGSMAFITSRLELIKEVIEKYKKVRTSLSYRDVWGVFRSLMDYIEFFNMGTPKSLLKKSANTWIGTKHELSYESDKIKSEGNYIPVYTSLPITITNNHKLYKYYICWVKSSLGIWIEKPGGCSSRWESPFMFR